MIENFSSCDYDRTRTIFDVRVTIDGCDVICTALEPEAAFHRAFKYQEFDITELSLSSYTMMTSRGDCPYVAIPAFVSRAAASRLHGKFHKFNFST